MKQKDHRIVWKEKSHLDLLIILNNFIEKKGISNIREYQKALNKHPQEAPSIWFITERFGSFEKMLSALGKPSYNRYRWNELSDEELEKLVKTHIQQNNVRSQRAYEKFVVDKDLPSLSTVKKRLGDVRKLFNKRPANRVTDFELLLLLKEEIINLGMEDNLSMTEFNKRCTNPNLPSTMTIMRRSNKTWEELMEELGFDYRSIKVKKLSNNLKNMK